MSLSLFLLPTLLLALGAHSYALPNPQAATITRAPATGATPAKLPASTSGTDYVDYSAYLASESRAYASVTAEWYRTAKSSDIAAHVSEVKAESADWAAFTSDLYRTLNSAELAEESRQYASVTAKFYRTAKASDLAALTADPYETVNPVAESRRYASRTAEFYRTAKSSDIAELNSERAAWAALTSDSYETVDPAEVSKQYASATAAFYATAKASDIARLASQRKEASAELAAWTSDLYRTPTPEEASSLSAEWRQYTSQAGVLETYTGTGSPFPFIASNATGSPFIASDATAGGTTATVPAQAAASTTGAASAAFSQGAFPPLQRSQSAPAADALTCLDSSASDMSDHTLQFDDCTATIQAICDNLTGDVANRVAGQWTWSAKGGKCAMGYWLPAIGDAVPSATACQANIFDRMRRTCVSGTGQGARWNAASVNIAVVPDAQNSGQQVDATKLSFLMAGSPYPCGSGGCKMLDQ
ncbi:hypothetical protein G7Y79_00024g055080 [Physcia stellaris]|nr:hypothetical protein G7Y79_00024g055080 [Physcia stellaris]